ncbi:MAG: class I mannose-6-phosphate isomerase [Ruminococcus sp.]|nr:class I mannose-6-phosphate isomerase [Ruminococcus sp.]
MDIMKLRPSAKDYIWGGTKLKREYNKDMGMERIAETWECSVHPDGPSKVISGEHTGSTLDSVIAEHPEYLGKNNKDGFPVLIKFIDAGKDLSVQVHPDDEYSLIHEHQNGKTEMWYIMEAEENTSLVYGFENEISESAVRRAVSEGEITEYLHYESVHKGDVFYIPAGTVHAIGKGAVIAEIQENSNITYRVYDYDRIDKNGNKRELHTEKALEVMNFRPAPQTESYDDYFECSDYSTKTLCSCRYFTAEKAHVKTTYDFYVEEDSFQVILCIEGVGTVRNNDNEVSMIKGDCIFLPADIGRIEVKGSAEFLKVKC